MSVELNDDYCPACKVPFTEHLGLVGTCKLKLEAEKDKDISIRDWCEMDTEIKAITTKHGVLDYHPVGYGFKSAEECVEEMVGKFQSKIARLRAVLEFQVGQKLKYHEALEEAVKMLGMDRPISPRQMMIEALSPSAPTSNLEDIGSKLGIEPSAPAESVEIDDIQFIETPSTLHQEAIEEYLRLTDPFAAPAEQEGVYGELYLTCLCINCGSTGDRNAPCPTCGKKLYQPIRRADLQGTWCEFVPSPENPTQQGDQWTWSSRDRDWRDCIGSGIGSDNPPAKYIYRRFHPATTTPQLPTRTNQNERLHYRIPSHSPRKAISCI